MTKPLPRQSVFRLVAEEMAQVERVLVDLNRRLEFEGTGPLRESSRLLYLGDVKPLVLNEVASRFQLAGYLVEVIPSTRGIVAMLRIK